ncbi:thermonuclease family protein [Kumtagia ephedrae]|uniref:Nuclease n=1 Tax=Kumtagia ephedrae TaxID=2116701 RepID=A0A2P7S8L7_9HYPH|nr:thermonuclease family protein [Mesorhizobium ephedrae]PSJ58814.1 hypothetical protein C7I84_15210 [Mesorhizobium ephedrae]
MNWQRHALCRHGLVLATVLMLAPGMPAQAASLAQASGELWSDKPKRVETVDPSLERLPAKPAQNSAVKPDRYPLKLKRAVPYQVIDSVSFMQEGRKYRLADLEPIPTAKTCRSADGQRWACGLRARVALNRLLGGNLVRCAPHGERDGFLLVECVRSGDKDIGGSLAAAGFALAPKGKARYRDEEEDARRQKSGIWADTAAAN